MNAVLFTSTPRQLGKGQGKSAFSLIELLVVIGIIGVLAALTIPAFKGIGSGTSRTSGERQLISDLGLARQYALKNRSTVYMVFVPPRSGLVPYSNPQLRENRAYDRMYDEHQIELNRLVQELNRNAGLRDLAERMQRSYTNAMLGQYTSYALYADRSVGDQPGSLRPRYLTEWRNLPDGVVFSQEMFEAPVFGPAPLGNPPKPNTNYFGLFTRSFPFPTVFDRGVAGPDMTLPYIAFQSDGRVRYPGLARTPDFYLAVSEGSVQLPRDARGQFDLKGEPDLVETPRRNYTNSFIRIASASGRARVEKPRME